MNKTNEMRKSITIFRLAIGIGLMSMVACKTNPVDKVQGIFNADKESLKTLMTEKAGSDNALAAAILNKAIENAVIEFKISGDSINGLIFLAGQTTIFNTEIQVSNDSMVIKSDNSEAYLIPNEKGLLFKNKTSDMSIQLLKSDKQDLSPDTKTTLKNLAQKQQELKEFTDNLNKWQKGIFVDEFGDKTGKEYPYYVTTGEHENSAVIKSEVYVKATMDGESLYFQIFNSSMTLKENFPNSEFGTIKIKFPNGDVKNETGFFYKNTVSESPDDKKPLIYNHLKSEQGELKILIDLGTASSYYSDKYQFTISKSNLDEILSKLK